MGTSVEATCLPSSQATRTAYATRTRKCLYREDCLSEAAFALAGSPRPKGIGQLRRAPCECKVQRCIRRDGGLRLWPGSYVSGFVCHRIRRIGLLWRRHSCFERMLSSEGIALDSWHAFVRARCSGGPGASSRCSRILSFVEQP